MDLHEPLMIAAHYGFDRVIETLLLFNAQVDRRRQVDGATALIVAARRNLVDTVRLLLEFDPDLSIECHSNEGSWTVSRTANKLLLELFKQQREKSVETQIVLLTKLFTQNRFVLQSEEREETRLNALKRSKSRIGDLMVSEQHFPLICC